MSQTLTKHLKEHSVALSDLDGLLVNAENFHKLFIQRIDPAWIRTTVNRIIKSDKHLKRLTHILVNFITSDKNHPEWVHHALAWFTYLINSPARQRLQTDPELREICRPLISYHNEMAGLKDMLAKLSLRCTTMQQWVKGQGTQQGIPRNLYYGGLFDVPSTGYVYVDDSDEEFGQRPARARRKPHEQQATTQDEDFPAGDITQGADSASELDDLFAEANEDFDLDEIYAEADGLESDHGVFDVNETASSDTQEMNSPIRPARGSIRSSQVNLGQYPDSNALGIREVPEDDDEEDIGIDEEQQDTEDSDEELDLLMWTGDQTSSSSDTDSDSKPPIASTSSRTPTSKQTAVKHLTRSPTAVKSESKRVTRQSTLQKQQQQEQQSPQPKKRRRTRKSL